MKAKSSLKDYMLSASIVMLLLFAVSKVFGYAFHLLFARQFSQEVYGQFIYLWSMGLFAAGLAPNIAAGVGRYIAYHRGEKNQRKVEAFKNTGMSLSVLFAVGWSLMLAGIYFMGLLPKVDDFGSLAFVGLIAAFTIVSNTLSQIITGYRRPQVSSLFSLLLNLLRFLGLCAAAYFALTLESSLYFVAAAFLLYVLIILAYVNSEHHVSLGNDHDAARELFRFGSYTLVFDTANNLLSWSGIFIINLMLGAAVVAVYNMAWLISSASLILFLSVLQVYRPVVTEFIGAGRRNKASYMTSYLFESFFMLFLPLFTLLIMFSREILSVFIGVSYASGALSLQILAIGCFFFGLSQLFMQVLSSAGKPETNAKIIAVAAAANICISLYLIPLIGIEGAAYSALVSYSLLFVLSKRMACYEVPMSYSATRILKFAASSVAMFFAYRALSPGAISVILLGVYSCVVFSVYLIAIMALKSLRQEDVELVSNLAHRAGFGKRGVFFIKKALAHGVGYSSASR